MTESPPTTSPPPNPARSLATTQALFAACASLCVGFLVWAAVGTLDIVSTAPGEVIPSSQVKSVQHLEGGIVREILVREGDRVTRDQPLVVLESTATGADVSEITVRIASLRLDVARLEAEETGAARPTFPADLVAAHPELADQTRNTFETRRNRLRQQLDGQRQTISQRQHEVREIGARLRNLQNNLRLINEQIKISEDLLKDELTNRYNHLNLLREAGSLKSRIEEDTAGLARAESALEAAKVEIRRIETAYLEEVGSSLETARRSLEEFTQRARKYSDSLQRTVLRAPVDGLVKTVHVSTEGGVVKAGGTVVDLVPIDDRLVIEAKLPTQDVGFVEPGLPATIKLASSDAIRFGNLKATVVTVSPDAIVNPQGASYYRVRLETERDHFENGGMRYRLVPGVQVTANIQIGQRTVLGYILSPFLDGASEALRER